MADPVLVAISPLAAVLPQGRHGETAGQAGVVAQERVARGCVSAASRAGQTVALTPPRRWSDSDGLRFVWNGPERWFAFGGSDIEARLHERFSGAAALTDQSDGRLVLRLSGGRVRDMLAKGLPIDLHPRSFGTGDVALSQIAHIVAAIWQIDDAPSYDLAFARSFAGSFAHWLIESAAEYGLEVLPPAS